MTLLFYVIKLTIANNGKTWILLVAGSKFYTNYRHQADICHAYRLFLNNGVPPERIIVMMYDDLIRSSMNPTPGVVINSPNGHDLYNDIVINFKGDDVNYENFVNVLMGNADAVKNIATSQVITSDPNDNIFINFVDHGGPGFLAFPNDLLHAIDFYKLVSRMVDKKKFAKMILFIEASFGGSVFEHVLQDFDNVYVMSASDRKEPSSACYYDAVRQTYLADTFSISWMKYLEREISAKLSFHNLYQKIRSDNEYSHVEVYGDLNVGSTNVLEFFDFIRLAVNYQTYIKPKDAVANPSVPVALIEQKLQLTTDMNLKSKFKDEMKSLFQRRSGVDQIMQQIVYHVVEDGDPLQVDLIQNGNLPVTKSNMHCVRKAIDTFSAHCFNIISNVYIRSVAFMFVNMCSVQFTNPEDITQAIRSTCSGIIAGSEQIV